MSRRKPLSNRSVKRWGTHTNIRNVLIVRDKGKNEKKNTKLKRVEKKEFNDECNNWNVSL